MSDLRTILRKTMPFAAADGADQPPVWVAPTAPIIVPPPEPQHTDDKSVIEKNPIWHWVHDAANPSLFSKITCRVRGMGMDYKMAMPVCDRIQFEDIHVTRPGDDREAVLALQSNYLIAKYFLPQGSIPESSVGLWQLRAEVDASLLLVFAYKVDSDGVSPLSMKEIDELGDRLMPEPQENPGACIDQVVTAILSPTRIVVCASLTTCKERADFDPGGVMSAARIFPHVLIVSNTDLEKISAPIIIERPSMSVPHDPEMLPTIKTAVYTDRNTDQSTGGLPPLPFWDNFFDYYELDAGNRFQWQELAFVDRTKKQREIRGAIQRLDYDLPVLPIPIPGVPVPLPSIIPLPNGGMWHDYGSPSTFTKLDGQGAFDNIHLAPTMTFTPTVGSGSPTTTNIAMAPFCMHDCLHSHVRWGTPVGPLPKWAKGFRGQEPYQVDGAPLVPENQSVFITVLSLSSFRYRGEVGTKLDQRSGDRCAIPRGSEQIVFHHGMAYACAIAEPNKLALARAGVNAFVLARREPYCLSLASESYGAFYWHLRYGGNFSDELERIYILDPEKVLQ